MTQWISKGLVHELAFKFRKWTKKIRSDFLFIESFNSHKIKRVYIKPIIFALTVIKHIGNTVRNVKYNYISCGLPVQLTC